MATDSPMPKAPVCIGFASGKGGVGKTFLAANFARVCSVSRKVLVIDLDFHNQGMTGLFSEHMQRQTLGAQDMLLAEAPIDLELALTVAPNVLFIPAHADMRHRDYLWDAERDPKWLIARLQARIAEAVAALQIEVVILDCHGGLDLVSLAAFSVANVTIIVTESDRVTFNGTLELIEFYHARMAAFEGATAREGPAGNRTFFSSIGCRGE